MNRFVLTAGRSHFAELSYYNKPISLKQRLPMYSLTLEQGRRNLILASYGRKVPSGYFWPHVPSYIEGV
jgi:hypothetical protein